MRFGFFKGNKLNKALLGGVLGLFTSMSAFSQDIHFSQFNVTATHLNPANTGNFSGDFRGVLDFKEQYSSFSNAYKTFFFSYDMGLFENSDGRKQTSIGFHMFQDQAGDSKTKTFNGMINLSQTVFLSKRSDLTLGLGMGIIQNSANYQNLLWDDQYNGLEVVQNSSSQETFSGRADNFADFNVGLLFRNFDYKGNSFQLGFSASHVTRAKTGIIDESDRLPVKYILHGHKEFTFKNDRWGITPSFFIANQNLASEINVGFLMSTVLGKSESKYTGYQKSLRLHYGVFYRAFDAIIPQVMIDFREKYTLGISYDVSMSDLSEASNGRGGLEVSFRLIGLWPGKYQTISPVTF